MQKTLDAIKAAIVASPLFYLLETYFFNDWEFLKFLLVAMVVDWVWGFRMAWRSRTVSLEGFQKFGKKLAEYGTLLVLGHILLNARSGGEPIAVLSYFTTTIHGYLLVREALSILEKIAQISPKLVPDWLLDRLKVYRDTGKVFTPPTDAKEDSSEEI